MSNISNGDTPRTDAESFDYGYNASWDSMYTKGGKDGKFVKAEFARKLEREIISLRAELAKAKEWTSEDEPIKEDKEIEAVHPVNVEDEKVHKVYEEALRMVGAKRSKYALVDLVHWLLWRIEGLEKERDGAV